MINHRCAWPAGHLRVIIVSRLLRGDVRNELIDCTLLPSDLNFAYQHNAENIDRLPLDGTVTSLLRQCASERASRRSLSDCHVVCVHSDKTVWCQNDLIVGQMKRQFSYEMDRIDHSSFLSAVTRVCVYRDIRHRIVANRRGSRLFCFTRTRRYALVC